MTIFKLWIKLIQNGYFQWQKEKNENRHQILYIQISLGSKFQLQQTILIFSEQSSQKMIFPVENRNITHRILHIQVILSNKFNLILIIDF